MKRRIAKIEFEVAFTKHEGLTDEQAVEGLAATMQKALKQWALDWRDVEGTSVGVDLRTLKRTASVAEEGE